MHRVFYSHVSRSRGERKTGQEFVVRMGLTSRQASDINELTAWLRRARLRENAAESRSRGSFLQSDHYCMLSHRLTPDI